MIENVKIFILESLPEEEKKTGKKLYENLLTFIDCSKLTYFNIKDSGDWYSSMEKIEENVSCDDEVFVHLEIHGTSDGKGICLSNDEIILFEKICKDFQNINIKCACQLIVTLAVCHGLWMVTGIVPLYEMPFRGLIGSQEEIKVYDLELRYNEFYKCYLEYGDIEYAMEELHKANPDLVSSYKYAKPHQIFIDSWKKYIDKASNLEWQRTNALNVMKEHNLTPAQKKTFEKIFKKEWTFCAKKLYEEKVNSFFMLEKFPDNVEIFDIPKFDDIK